MRRIPWQGLSVTPPRHQKRARHSRREKRDRRGRPGEPAMPHAIAGMAFVAGDNSSLCRGAAQDWLKTLDAKLPALASRDLPVPGRLTLLVNLYKGDLSPATTG